MPLFRRSSPPAAAEPWPWWRRHKVISTVVVAVLLASALVAWRPWQDCGPGLAPAGSPEVCVGLNLDSGPFRAEDPLADLEKKVADHNAKITAPDFITVVLVNDMTPNPEGGGVSLSNVRHGIEGAITAASRANTEPVAGGTIPPVKLLLANYGTGGASHQQAKEQILAAQDEQHIVAVTGLGQSLTPTRQLASDLSARDIAVVGSLVSGDDMNQVPDTDQNIDYIQRFFRITPTNADAAKAAVSYLEKRNYPKVMLVQDTNPNDGYSATLSEAFQREYQTRFDTEVQYTMQFKAPDKALNDVSRPQYMTKVFEQKRGEICQSKPNLIYFAGRGVDMASFVNALTAESCGLPPFGLLTSDDATSIDPGKLDTHGHPVEALYTGTGTRNQWKDVPKQEDNMKNYDAFERAFARFGKPDVDLVDGYAMANHDAVLLAAEAARLSPSPVANPTLVTDSIKNTFTCANPFLGASGKIAFSQEPHRQGNPINKAMPIMQIHTNGSVEQRDLVWSNGRPFDEACH